MNHSGKQKNISVFLETTLYGMEWEVAYVPKHSALDRAKILGPMVPYGFPKAKWQRITSFVLANSKITYPRIFFKWCLRP